MHRAPGADHPPAHRTTTTLGPLRLSTNTLSPAERIDPDTMITAIQALGAQRMHLGDVNELNPSDPDQPLADLGEAVRSSGLSCTIGAQFISPTHPNRNPTISRLAHDRGWAPAIGHLIRSAHAAGMPWILAMVGHQEDRLHPPAWARQLQEVTKVLQYIVPILKDTGTMILLKSHPDLNTAEMLRLVESTDSSVVRVAFDPVNVVTRGEDPVEAARQVAGIIDVIAVDDMVITRTDQGVVRIPVPLGAGDLPWATLNGVLPAAAERLLDLKRASIRLSIDNPEWCRAQGWSNHTATLRLITDLLGSDRSHQLADAQPIAEHPLVYTEPWTLGCVLTSG